MKNIISREHFEAWLYAQPPTRVVNLSDPGECLICQFLKETTQFKKPKANWRDIKFGRGIRPAQLPVWFRRWINEHTIDEISIWFFKGYLVWVCDPINPTVISHIAINFGTLQKLLRLEFPDDSKEAAIPAKNPKYQTRSLRIRAALAKADKAATVEVAAVEN